VSRDRDRELRNEGLNRRRFDAEMFVDSAAPPSLCSAMAVNDRIDPIRGDIAELRHLMEARFTAQKAETDAAIRTAIEGQTRFFFVAWGVLLAAVVGLYGTVIAIVR
jgi:hypothetical protein